MASDEKPTIHDYFRAIFLYIPDNVSMGKVLGQALLFLVFFIWGWIFMLHPVDADFLMNSFLHKPNLVFHEAGHIIFSPFGRFIGVLGGSLAQLLMPFIIMCAFLITNRDAFGASVALWWVGQNFMDIAPYIGDARDLKLPLLGGVTGRDVVDYHDWEYLLGKTGLLTWDHSLAKFSHYFGSLLMLTAFVWGGYILYRY